MAILFMDGMDSYRDSSDGYRRYHSSRWDGMVTGRFGTGYGIRHYGECYNRVLLPTQPTEAWICQARNWTEGFNALGYTAGIGDCFVTVCTTGLAYQVSVSTDGSTIKAWRGKPGEVLLGQASYTVARAVWHWVEVRVKMDGAAGEVEVWFNGQQAMLLTGLNTIADSSQPYIAIAASEQNYSGRTHVDDIVILDTTGSTNNGRPGDCRIRSLAVTGDAGPNQGTPSSGTAHYPLVSEQPVDTNTYVALDFAQGQTKEEFDFADLATDGAQIKAVQVVAMAYKDDGGTANGRAYIKSGSSVANSPPLNLSTTLTVATIPAEVDPATGAPWTRAAVNAAKIGYEATA